MRKRWSQRNDQSSIEKEAEGKRAKCDARGGENTFENIICGQISAYKCVPLCTRLRPTVHPYSNTKCLHTFGS